MSKRIIYPYQVAALKQGKNGTKKTISFEAHLEAACLLNESEKNMPLEMHSCFSRFMVTIIKKSDEGVIFPRGNIPAEDVYYIFEKTKKLLSSENRSELQLKDTEQNSLQENEAFEIYNEQIKPLLSTKDPGNKCLVYGIKILYHSNRRLPFSIEISNCRAVVETLPDGKLNVRMKEANNHEKVVMNMSEKQWFKIINRMYMTLLNFEALHFEGQLKAAKDEKFRKRHSILIEKEHNE